MLRLGGLSFSGTNPGAQGNDLSLGSIGGSLRLNLDPYWALEVSGDIAWGEDQMLGLTRQTTPLTGSLVVNLLPHSFLNVYVLAGGGVYFTEAKAVDCGYKESYRRMAAHVGGGLELRLGPVMRLFSELRLIGLAEPTNERSSYSLSPQSRSLAMQEGDQAVQMSAGLAVYF